MRCYRRFQWILLAAVVCALFLAGCNRQVGTRLPSTPRPVRTSAPDITPTPTPVGPGVAGTIPLRQGIGPNPSGLWLDETHHYLYTLCTGELDIVETTTRRTTRVPVPIGAQVLALDSASRRILLGGAGGSGTSDLLLLDAASGRNLRTVALSAPPWRTLYLPQQNIAMASLGAGKIAAVDMDTGISVIVSAGGAHPLLQADAEAGKVYLSGAPSGSSGPIEDALSVLDIHTGKVEIVLLPAPATAFVLHPRTHQLFILHQYDGALSVYAPDSGLADTLTLGGEPSEIALDAGLDTVYVSDWSGGRLLVLDAQTLQEKATLQTFPNGHFLRGEAVAHRLILAQAGTSQAALIYRDGVTPLSLPDAPGPAAIHPSTGVSYITIPGMKVLLALAPDGTEFMQWTLPDRPEAIVVDAVQDGLFVSIPAADEVAIIDLNSRRQDVLLPALVPSAAVVNPVDGLLYATDPPRAAVHALGLTREQGARSISVGPHPVSLAVNSLTGVVLAACADGVYSIQPGDSWGNLIVPSQSAPLLGVSGKLNLIYVGLPGPPASVQILDGTAHRLLKTLSVGGTLLALTVHEDTGRLITLWQSAARPGIVTLSVLTGQTLEERRVEVFLHIPAGARVAARVDVALGQVCIAYGSQRVRIALVDWDTGEVRFLTEVSSSQDVPSAFAPFTLQSDAVSSKTYLAVYGGSEILVLDSRSAVSSTLSVDGRLTSLELDAARTRIYVSQMDGAVAILDGRENRIVETVPVGGAAHILAADLQRQRVFAVDPWAALVHVVRDPAASPVVEPTPTVSSSGTPQVPASPWTTFASGDQVRTLVFDGIFVWAGAADGGMVRWNPANDTFRQYLAPQDGLHSSDVRGVAVGSAGSVWAATGRGVSRYNGVTWNTEKSDVSGAPDGAVRSIARDTEGRIWVGTEAGGLHRMRDGVWETFPPEALGLQGSWITEIGVDALGRQWLASWLGVSVIDGENVVTYTAQNSGLPPGVVNALLVLTDGNVVAGTDTGLALFQSGAWTVLPKESGAPDHVTSLAQTDDGALWAASPSGIYRYAIGEWRAVGSVRVAVETYMPVWAQTVASSQQWPIVSVREKVWAILDSGLADFDGQVWTRHSTSGASPPVNQGRTLGLGLDGELWAGFSGSSPTLYKDGRWATYTGRDQLYTNANAILTDTEGRVWIASDEGVSQYDGKRWTQFKAGDGGLLKGRVLALAWNPAGTLWVGTEQGLNAWRKGAWTAYTTANSGLASNTVLALAVDPEGVLWCATSGGVSRYDGKDWQTFTDSASLPTEQEISALAVGDSGHRWFRARHAVRRLAGASWFNYRDVRETVEYDFARILKTVNNPNGLWTVDQIHSKVWVSADGGVQAYNGSEWEVYTPDNSGLASGVVRAILVDGEGAIWFATDKGISRLSP